MRESVRRGLAKAAVVLSAAVLLSGCFGGGAPHPDRADGDGAAAAAGPAPKPTPTWDTHPASLAALGDSITRGFDACGLLADCPAASWATGRRADVDSLATRLLGAG